jgi:hypothetical protein
MRTVLRWLLAFVLAVLITTVLGSIIQTQFNIASITALGAPAGFDLRLEVTAFDLLSFAPTYAIVAAFALLIALLVAAWPASAFPAIKLFWYGLAGFLAIYTALTIMNSMLPVTVIGAARTPAGMVSLSMAGALGGWLYGRIWAQRQNGQN